MKFFTWRDLSNRTVFFYTNLLFFSIKIDIKSFEVKRRRRRIPPISKKVNIRKVSRNPERNRSPSKVRTFTLYLFVTRQPQRRIWSTVAVLFSKGSGHGDRISSGVLFIYTSSGLKFGVTSRYGTNRVPKIVSVGRVDLDPMDLVESTLMVRRSLQGLYVLLNYK